MDARTNPYAPGAGTLPPELAGRSEIMEKASIAMDRCRNGLSHRSILLIGLRGVGKTVLLTRISQQAESDGFVVISSETSEKRSLPAVLIPALRTALLKIDRLAAAGNLGKRALKVFGGFVSAMKIKYGDIEFNLDMETEAGADTGDLEHDLAQLFIEIAKAAREKKTALIMFIDEIQYIKPVEFSSLIMALHKCTQLNLPITLIGAGLPQVVGRAGNAKSYAERLFEYPEIGPLSKEAAIEAIQNPAKRNNVIYNSDALNEIFSKTQGYPYFLQEWGKHCWQCAIKSPITLSDAKDATEIAILELDSSFFRVRFDRLTPMEKKYLRAMAELGSGSQRSGDIAELMKREVQSVAPIRNNLINKGMIYSTAHGENNFTVPLFDEYMKRVLPEINEFQT